MSWQAYGAVMQASSFIQGRAFAGFRVLQAIAWFADEEGVAGRAGQPHTCPTQETLSRVARVHVNTVRNWLPKLETAGELARERHGAGRGSHTVYRILLPMAGGREAPREGTAKARRARAGERGAEKGLAQRVARLEQKLEALLAREEGGTAKARRAQREERGQGGGQKGDSGAQGRAQARGGKPQAGGGRPQVGRGKPQVGGGRPQVGGKKPTRVQRGDVDDPLDPVIDPKLDPEGDPGGSARGRSQARAEGHKAPRAAPVPGTAEPPPTLRNGPAAHGKRSANGPASSDDAAAFQERVAALAEVCGLDLRLKAHRKRCQNVARELAPYSAAAIRRRFAPLPPGSARSTQWQWYLDDWRGSRKGEQPRLRDVVENISRRRVPPASPAPPGGPAVEDEPLTRQGKGATPLGRAQIAFREFVTQEAADNGRRPVTYGV